MISDEELAGHPDPRVDPGICGIVATHTAAGARLAIERICIRPPHDQEYRRRSTDPGRSPYVSGTSAHPERPDGVQSPPAERHYFVARWPNRETLDNQP